MSEPKPIYRTDGQWMALVYNDNLFDTAGEWIGWLDEKDVYSLEGEYVGFLTDDGRLLRQRVLPYRKRRKPPAQPPRVKVPQTVPLPPLFAELSYSVVDVFEEDPGIFALIHELRPDYGEDRLLRLVKTDPNLAVQHKLRKVEQDLLEEMAHGLIYSYGISEPPVPVEAMAAGVPPEKANDVQISSPHQRLRTTEQFLQRLGYSSWAMERGYSGPEGFTPTRIQYAARALLLPRHWILKIPRELRNASELAQRYIVPEETAILRIHDLE